MNQNNEKEYLKDHSKTKKLLRTFGWICLSIGIVCLAVSLVDFFSSAANFEEPSLFFMGFIGIPLLGAGGAMLSFGYMKEVSEYTASQTAPVQKDVANYMLDGTREELAKTLNAASERENVVEVNICAKCGEKNPGDAKFCSKCGSSLIVTCPHCGHKNDDGANFCNNCGEKL